MEASRPRISVSHEREGASHGSRRPAFGARSSRCGRVRGEMLAALEPPRDGEVLLRASPRATPAGVARGGRDLTPLANTLCPGPPPARWGGCQSSPFLGTMAEKPILYRPLWRSHVHRACLGRAAAGATFRTFFFRFAPLSLSLSVLERISVPFPVFIHWIHSLVPFPRTPGRSRRPPASPGVPRPLSPCPLPPPPPRPLPPGPPLPPLCPPPCSLLLPCVPTGRLLGP